MQKQQERILYDYLNQFPDSLTRRQIDFDNDELMDRIVPLMVQALSTDKALSDDIFNSPEAADL